MPIDDLSKISHKNISDLSINNDNFSFKTDKKTLNIIKNDFEYVYSQNICHKKLKNLISKHLISIIGLFIFILMIGIVSKTITEIVFLDETTYNEEVNKFVEDRLTKVGPFRFLRGDLNKIDSELKNVFYQYEWIGISQKGTSLIIEIEPSFLDIQEEDSKKSGSIYAKKDAIIKKYHLEKGIVMVQEDQYVKAGDLLISGDIVHYDNTFEQVHPLGYVIGEVLEYYEFTIEKVNTKTERNGKIYYQDFWAIKNKTFGKSKNKFLEYDLETKTIFNLFNFFFVKRIYYFEKEEIKKEYDFDSAKEYAMSLIYKKFMKNKTNDNEKIVYIKLARYGEDNNNYYFRFVVKSEESIGEFKPNS